MKYLLIPAFVLLVLAVVFVRPEPPAAPNPLPVDYRSVVYDDFRNDCEKYAELVSYKRMSDTCGASCSDIEKADIYKVYLTTERSCYARLRN